MIQILMPTYNGSKFLESQLESLINQTNQDWKLLIRDDGSSDSTRLIIEKWAAAHPSKIYFLAEETDRLGATGSFSRLLEYSSSSYVMLCDRMIFGFLIK